MQFLEFVKKELAEVETEIQNIIPQKPKEVYGILPDFFRRGGKRIRPAIVILSTLAMGGDAKKAIKPATLVELFHNFTLIHDDIEDNSTMRRGEPTLNNKYGVPIALNSGDALYTTMWQEIYNMDFNEIKILRLQKLFATAFRGVVEGQGVELYWHKNNVFNLSEKDYFSMVEGKTGALMGLSFQLGAEISDASNEFSSKLKRFGERIGVAFQIYDDFLNVEGDFEKYKKEICGDITEGKRTLMVIKTLEKATSEESSKLKKILSSGTKDSEDFDYVIRLFKKYGALDYSKEIATKLVKEAKDSIKSIPENKYKAALLEIADFVINRES